MRLCFCHFFTFIQVYASGMYTVLVRMYYLFRVFDIPDAHLRVVSCVFVCCVRGLLGHVTRHYTASDVRAGRVIICVRCFVVFVLMMWFVSLYFFGTWGARCVSAVCVALYTWERLCMTLHIVLCTLYALYGRCVC